MIVDVSKKILIVGLGLLGGSYARILKRFGFHISAITKEQSFILSREFVLRNYKTELDSIMDIYNSMTTGDGGEQSIFYNHMGGLPNLDYVIKYLGLSSLLP